MINILFTIFFFFLNGQSSFPEPKIEIIYLPSITNTETEFEMREQAYQSNFKYTTNLVRIANCESKMGKYRNNWQGSGAEGILMFKPRTFNAYCKGSIKIDKDQIDCFIKMYPKKESWWECK